MSQFFPINYEQKYAIDYEAKMIKAKVPTQNTDKYFQNVSDVNNIAEYFKIFSQIYKRPFDITTMTKLKVYLSQLQEQIIFQCNTDQPITIYKFLKNNCTASLQFRMHAQFEYQSVFNSLTKYFVTDSQFKEIINRYKLPQHYRVDSLILNMSYHLMKFLQQYTDIDSDIIGLMKKFYPRVSLPNMSDSEDQQKDMTHYPEKHFLEGNFIQLFNDIYKPQQDCLSTSDMLKEINLFYGVLEQHQLNFETIKQFIVRQYQVFCDCEFKVKNLIINKSIEQIQKIVLNEKLLSYDVKNFNHTYSKFVIEILQIFCMIKTWCISTLKNQKGYTFNQNTNLRQLLSQTLQQKQILFKKTDNIGKCIQDVDPLNQKYENEWLLSVSQVKTKEKQQMNTQDKQLQTEQIIQQTSLTQIQNDIEDLKIQQQVIVELLQQILSK